MEWLGMKKVKKKKKMEKESTFPKLFNVKKKKTKLKLFGLE